MHSLRNSPPDCFSQLLTHLEPRVSCTACNSLIAPYKIIIYKNVGPDAHIRPLVPDFLKALRSILFPPPCGQGEFGPVRPGGGAGLAIRSSRQYAPTPASAPCDKAHYLQKGAIQQWNCSFFLLCYVLPKARLFSRAGGRTDGENPAPPDQRATASNPGCVAGAGHSWGSPRR